MSNFKAVIFDLDGTLLNTLDDLADSMNSVIRSMGFTEHPVDAYRYFVGDGVEMLARRVLPADVSDDSIRECLALMRQEYSVRWAEKTVAYEGIDQLLAELQQQKIPVAVLSNKADDFTKQMVAHFFPCIKFADVVGARPDIRKKPDPSAALDIASNLKIDPQNFIYAGDTSTDMQTAIAAGMLCVGVLWGFRPREELLAHGAQRLIDHPLDLLHLL